MCPKIKAGKTSETSTPGATTTQLAKKHRVKSMNCQHVIILQRGPSLSIQQDTHPTKVEPLVCHSATSGCQGPLESVVCTHLKAHAQGGKQSGVWRSISTLTTQGCGAQPTRESGQRKAGVKPSPSYSRLSRLHRYREERCQQ